MVYARHSRANAGMVGVASVVILIANMVVLVRLGVLGAVVSPSVLVHLVPVVGFGILFGLLSMLAGWRKLQAQTELPLPETANPTEIHTALGFGALYGAVLLCAAWLTDIAGSKGLYFVAMVSGLTDMDAITLSSLRLLDTGKLSETQAVTGIALAYFANMMFKFGLLFFIGGRELARHTALSFLAICAGVGLGLVFV
jgi:uncharacterized membrane protein (DUF4010 family)